MKTISVVIPAKNEEGNVKPLVERLHKTFSEAGITYELIVINDRSTDKTRPLLEKLGEKYPVRVFDKKGAPGKAQGLWEGFSYAKYDVIGIIDADLQYPPEAFPEMLAKIDRNECDIVQANREEKNVSFFRKIPSQIFRFIFVRLLHGLTCDSQAGLKVFRKQITREMKPTAKRWSFDLEFIINALHAGWRIGTVDIVFAERHSGQAKLNVLVATFELAFTSLTLFFRNLEPVAILPHKEGTMTGAGIADDGHRFVTHSTLDRSVSAFETFKSWQILLALIAVASLAGSFYLWPLKTGIGLMGVLSAIYFIDVVFNLFVVMRSMRRPPEIHVTQRELKTINDSNLPVYSILCPLYRESEVLPGFLKSIDALQWPKDKLDVLLLLEENDHQTIEVAQTMGLPSYVRMIIVPHSLPKTKPKACNYGLGFSRGDFVVIYDAEDIPDPMQLKKAYLAFQKVSPRVKCLQAKLNYHNTNYNFITRLFTAEYSLWFDVTLPGLQSIDGYIPLGGTSNHFRTQDLKDLKGWDAFNVTEDCDLGARIFKNGHLTAMIDSVTLEEATSRLGGWIRQRSRWIKGYMQTYLVHMRHPVRFFLERGTDALMFQLVVGGKIMFLLINPLLWLMTVAYFALYATVGPTIEALYPTTVFYMAGISLVFGNFMFLFYYMIGCAKRGHWSVVKFVFLMPFYWLMASVAAVMALYQLIVKPHFWEKTQHGLSMKPKETVVSETAQEQSPVGAPIPVMQPAAPSFFAKFFVRDSFGQGGVLIMTMMFANFVNFLFNAFLGRTISLADLASITLVNTILSVASLFIGAFSSTVNRVSAYLSASDDQKTSASFARAMLKRGMVVMAVVTALWILLVPIIATFFQIGDRWVLWSFTPVLIFATLGAVSRGYLQGNLFFIRIATIVLLEAIGKLGLAAFFVFAGLPNLVHLAIPLSVVFASLIALSMVRKDLASAPKKNTYVFPVQFFTSSLLTGISSVVFFSFDILLAKHFLAPDMAGQYILLSLVGKMIFFFGSLPNAFMTTFVSRDLGAGKDPRKIFNLLFGSTLGLVTVGYILLGPFGHLVVPFLLGAKTLPILKYLSVYALAMGLFTLSNSVVSYQQARQRYVFSFMAFAFSLLMVGGLLFFHANIGYFVTVILVISVGMLLSFLGLSKNINKLRFAERGIVDFLDVFTKSIPDVKVGPHKRILVFNWRDTRHAFAGGAEVYVQELAKRWVAKGHQVTLFCGNDAKSPRNEVVDGIQIIRRGGFYFVYIWAFFYYIFQFRGKYDVVIDCHNGVPFFTPLYAKEPVVCVVHHVHQEVFRHSLSKPLAALASFLERDLMSLVYRNTHFITVSQSSRDEMVAMGLKGSKIDIVHNGIDLENLHPGVKSKTPLVLYLGRLKAYKSVDVLIRAFREVVKKSPDTRLVIAGSGEEEGHLKRLTRQLGLEGYMQFTGRISEEEKIGLLQRAWVVANPSFMEGWGITTIEAGACGTPMVASDVPGLRDSVRHEHTGYLVAHGDTSGFANNILRLIENKQLRDEMAQRSYQWAQNFGWQKSADKLSAILRAKVL